MIVSKIKRGAAASARHVSSGMHMRMNLYFISSSPARRQLSCVPLVSSKDIEFPTRVCQWMICSSRGRGPATSAAAARLSAATLSLSYLFLSMRRAFMYFRQNLPFLLLFLFFCKNNIFDHTSYSTKYVANNLSVVSICSPRSICVPV